MFLSLVIISLLVFPPSDAPFRLQQLPLRSFSSAFRSLIELLIKTPFLIGFPQNQYVATTIFLFANLVKA